MPTIRLLGLLLAFVLPRLVAAQEAPPPELKAVPGMALRYVVQRPPGHAPEKWVPLLVVFAAGDGEEGARAAVAKVASVAAAGFVVVAPVFETADAVDLAPLFTELRRVFRIDQGGMHAFFADDEPARTTVARAQRHQFQTFTGASRLGRDFPRLAAQRVATAPQRADAYGMHFAGLHAERELRGAAAEVARVLDDFHDAAANADEVRYFAILPDDAMFLGTDGTERWSGERFRKDYGKYFERESAWTYVTLRRAVDVDEGGTFAWFDESFDNEAYGECRGSGVMQKRDGRWVLRQYHLTVPVPNDVTREVAARIRAFQDGVPAVTTIVLVRHAEKADDGEDPELSAVGKERAEALARTLQAVPLAALYSSQYRRTIATAEAVGRAKGIDGTIRIPAKDVATLATRLRSDHRGRTALVCGHSNTIPAIIKALGVNDAVAIADDEYGLLFVVTLAPEGARLLRLRYGK